jgi:hypothetical protein
VHDGYERNEENSSKAAQGEVSAVLIKIRLQKLNSRRSVRLMIEEAIGWLTVGRHLIRPKPNACRQVLM